MPGRGMGDIGLPSGPATWLEGDIRQTSQEALGPRWRLER